jgi:hypothetical protein
MSEFPFTVCLSVNDNYDYYKNMPLVYKAWKSFFPECRVVLGFVNSKNKLKHRTLHQDVIDFLEDNSDELVVVDEIGGIPTENQGKFLRYWVASIQSPETKCLIHDVDSLPLQSNYWKDYIFQNYRENKLLAVGHDVYAGTEHEGKFPASNMMGDAEVFKKMINPQNPGYHSVVFSYTGIRMFDDKERLEQMKQHFSDESLVRYMIVKNLGLDNVNFIDRKIDIRSQWLDKTFWSFNKSGIENGSYIECNLPRSFDTAIGVKSINLDELVNFISDKYNSKAKSKKNGR